MTILDAMRDPALFGPWFPGESWNAWRVFLAATFGLPIEDEGEAALYAQCTGRTKPPGMPAREAWVVGGRRGGKSRIAALIAVYLACFRDYRAVLAPGEVATLPVIAADRRQARNVLRYLVGFFDAVPMLKKMVVGQTREAIELTNSTIIEVHTANFRSVRGYTTIGAVLDEVAFWKTDDGAANPDTEILAGLRPGLATVPGALLVCISSPYARRGALWETYRRHHGHDDDGVLVWQAATSTMNPLVDARVIAEAYEQDPEAAAAEFGAEFRRDIEAFISREAVETCVIPSRIELPPTSGVRYVAFVDPAGGSGADSMTLCIGHIEKDGRRVVDALRERRPPFSPADVVAECAAVMKSYRIARVVGDRFGGGWPAERFAEHGIRYVPADKSKSDLFRDLLPLLNSRRVELPDHPRLIGQLCGLERKTARGGRDSIDHAPGAHDDVANAVAGALLEAKRRPLIFATGAGGPGVIEVDDAL